MNTANNFSFEKSADENNTQVKGYIILFNIF